MNRREDGEVVCQVQAQPAPVKLDTAVPLGLIATELIGNAFKHAFAGRSAGKLLVRLERDAAARQLPFTVSDDGCGLPASFDCRVARSLGSRLIRSLAQQLRAELSMSSQSGLCVTLRVPQ